MDNQSQGSKRTSPHPSDRHSWWWRPELPHLSFFVPDSSSLLSLGECRVEDAVRSRARHAVGEMLCQRQVASSEPCTRVQIVPPSVGARANPVRIARGSSHWRAPTRRLSSQRERSRSGRFSPAAGSWPAACLFTLFNPSSEGRSAAAAANLIRSMCVEAPFGDDASPPWWSSFLTNCLSSCEGQVLYFTHRLSKLLSSEFAGLPDGNLASPGWRSECLC